MKYYPVFLNLEGRTCVVVGGGPVAERKVRRLLECGAQVKVISPDLTPWLASLKREGKIEVIEKRYEAAFLSGAFLVIGATGDPRINDEIYQHSRKEHILVNIVDDPNRCDFILPSIIERGDLSVAVSTAGKSPALARKMREELSSILGPEYATLLEIMGAVREQYRRREPDSQKRRAAYERLLNTEILEEIRCQRWEKVEEIVEKQTGINIKLRGD